jgi:hypothetical protein
VEWVDVHGEAASQGPRLAFPDKRELACYGKDDSGYQMN